MINSKINRQKISIRYLSLSKPMSIAFNPMPTSFQTDAHKKKSDEHRFFSLSAKRFSYNIQKK
ncbi:MAG: hypothetical protein Q4C75_00645 [Bergeyella zoohelcum]|nr:hypothetical protein [Bergeyella zoohelcum]